MSILHVPGAQLYYEVQGSGPAIVLIPGAPGHARVFGALAEQLASRYTVVTYDRRGFSRSHLDGAQDHAQRLRTDAWDVARLIRCLGEPSATVFGSSSGGVVALQLLVEQPEVVDTVIPYEPAALRFLALEKQPAALDLNEQLYELYRHRGLEAALEKFRGANFPESDQVLMSRPIDPDLRTEVRANTVYWFEHELRQYTAARFDRRVLIEHGDKVMPAAGRVSRGFTTYDTALGLAEALDRPVLELPGGHVGYATEPAGFAAELVAALPESRGSA